MFFLGITGGVGAGKSEVLGVLRAEYGAEVLSADDIAKELMLPGTPVYAKIRETFAAEDVFLDDGTIDRPAMAALLFGDDERRRQMNALVHPAVLEEVLRRRDRGNAAGGIGLLVLEAALLLEAGYDASCDEVWYIYASEEVRRQRLAASRGYSEARIASMMKSQLPEAAFRNRCAVTIDNGGSLADTRRQIRERMKLLGISRRDIPEAPKG